MGKQNLPMFKMCGYIMSVSIAQWLEPWPSDPAVVGSNPGWGYVPAILWSRTSWQVKAMPGTSLLLIYVGAQIFWLLKMCYKMKFQVDDRENPNIYVLCLSH